MTEIKKIEVTQKAVEEIRKIQQANNIPETHGLRVGIKGGGCCGTSYMMAFDDKTAETDHVFESSGLKIYIDNISYDFLSGAQLDYKENEYGSGFVFNNVKSFEQNPESGCSSGSCCG